MLYAIVAHTGYDMTQKARDFHARTAMDWQEQGPAGGSNKQQQQTGGMGVDQFLPSFVLRVRTCQAIKWRNRGI